MGSPRSEPAELESGVLSDGGASWEINWYMSFRRPDTA